MSRSAQISTRDPEKILSGSDALARLTPFGWRGGLAVIVLLLAISFLFAGYFIAYWRNADMDFMVVYSALSLNDGRYVFFPHPAYLTIISISRWFEFLHRLGLLDAPSLSAIPSASNVPAFDAAMTAAIRAGRVLAFLTATTFVLAFAGLARLLVRDWRVALLATFAFAFSGGVAVHMRILRSEMIAGCFFVFALMILIAVARRGTGWRPLAIGFAAMLCVLALENKIHAILLISVLPVLILPFGSASGASAVFWNDTTHAGLAVLIAALVTALMIYLSWPLIVLGINPAGTDMASLKPLLFGRFGVYQAALLGWIFICMLAFAKVWRVRLTETLAAMFAVVAGASLGLLALFIDFDASNVVIVLNPLEEMLTFADPQAISAAGASGPFAAIGLLLSGVVSVLQRYTFFLFTSPRPAVFLTWLILPGIVCAWRRGERQAALQVAMLIVSAIAIDALGVRRGLKAEYFILTDPLIIIAGMVLLDRMSDFRFHRWAYAIGATLIVLHVGISQAEPVKSMTKRAGPEGICEWNQHYLPRLPLPWCAIPLKL
ncbi:MAG: hypothetical protein Q7V17_04085 [Afipia sp.]|nr:hypothetical protein [Afipia sp.]